MRQLHFSAVTDDACIITPAFLLYVLFFWRRNKLSHILSYNCAGMFDRLPLAFSQIPSHWANRFFLTFFWIVQLYTTATLPQELQLSAFECISVVLAVPDFVRVVRTSQYLEAEAAITSTECPV